MELHQTKSHLAVGTIVDVIQSILDDILVVTLIEGEMRLLPMSRLLVLRVLLCVAGMLV